jgi:hypothetical protein
MSGVGVRRAFCAPEHSVSHLTLRRSWRPFRALAMTVLAATVGGCASQIDNLSPFAMASQGAASGASIAFESIDGPPPAVFGRMVTTLNEEADARHLTVVSRNGPATYRVRAYVSALVDKRKTSFAWVWDVYDADKQRVLRITGEETAARPRPRDAWGAADDQVVHRIARTGMERIAAFVAEPSGTALAQGPTRWLFASTNSDSPEAAGIVRTSGGDSPPPAMPAH